MAEMPLSDQRRRVALLLQKVGDRHFVLVDPDIVVWKEHALQADALRVAPRHQRRARRRADGGRGVEVGELHPLRRELVDVRRLDLGRAVAREIVIADVVTDDVNDVDRLIRRENAGGQQAARQSNHCEDEGPNHGPFISAGWV